MKHERKTKDTTAMKNSDVFVSIAITTKCNQLEQVGILTLIGITLCRLF